MGICSCCASKQEEASMKTELDKPSSAYYSNIVEKDLESKNVTESEQQDKTSTQNNQQDKSVQEFVAQINIAEEQKEAQINNDSIQVQQSKTVFDQMKDLHDSGIDLHALNQQEQNKWIELIINEETQKDPQKMKTMKEAIKKRTGKKSF